MEQLIGLAHPKRLQVLAAAHDTGGANALLPVVRKLRAHAAVRAVACAQAALVWERAGLAHQRTSMDSSEDLNRFLAEEEPDALLLGTSWGQTLDKRLLRMGEERGIPSVAVVDSWMHYRERFFNAEVGRLCLPTKIAVPDQRAAAEARIAGLPQDRLEITGHPHLSEVTSAFQSHALQAQAHALRRRWLAGRREGPVVLFVSEAFSQYNVAGSAYYFGYTEVEALEGLVEAVERLEADGSDPIRLVVKLHPRQFDEPISRGPAASRRDMVVVGQESPWACLLAADVIVGMSSMLLLEAALAGKPVISFRPMRPTEASTFMGTEIGLIEAAMSVPELIGRLTPYMEPARLGAAAPSLERLSFIRTDAAERIAKLVLDAARVAQSSEATPRP